MFGPETIVLRLAIVIGFLLILPDAAYCNEPAVGAAQGEAAAVDRSGRELRGKAAIFARHLAGRRMADGGFFNPEASVVASNTLPLGATARVTNLQNGQVAMVRVRDRISGTDGRILNVSPKVAEFLGVRRSGVFPVAVAPLAVPQADGNIQLGSGTGLAGRRAHITGNRDRR
ncbi:hypothetical protein JMJ56_21185 [Belnapia sp. T18]|uniref:RlpA-like protein double-psi beta-barrel domain-containing protein n=1 Tax=Belnapia arida TaxID=2804533 RepID=A0ABS1U7N0_9PROT|nr:RlpA-like double-psi beta-barrel domain-containing protein [Belnapia arida]MBL6080535.1 hypothetical protein [Belnapia arida]